MPAHICICTAWTIYKIKITRALDKLSLPAYLLASFHHFILSDAEQEKRRRRKKEEKRGNEQMVKVRRRVGK
jgi:hypothetical protein